MRPHRAAKLVGLLVVGALGLAICVTCRRDTTRATTPDRMAASDVSPSQFRHAPIASSTARVTGAPVRRVPSAPGEPSGPSRETLAALGIEERRTLEPDPTATTPASPELREYQKQLWQQLRAFAREEKLTDQQWEQFERDLLELGATNAVAYFGAARTGDFDGVRELTEELELELEQRLATYMTEQQVRTLRFRLPGLVWSVRTHFLPTGPGIYPGPDR